MHKIEIPVASEPLFIATDGVVFIVKDKTKKLRNLSKEEQIKFGGTFKESSAKSKTSTYKPPQSKQEKGVKITVKRMDKKEEFK